MAENRISNNLVLMLIDLYNSLDVNFFRKFVKMNRKDFCYRIGISENNHKTYTKVIKILETNLVAQNIDIFVGNSPKTVIEIDSRRLDTLIRSTEYFKKIDDFIFKSTGGIAETGV